VSVTALLPLGGEPGCGEVAMVDGARVDPDARLRADDQVRG